MNENKDTMTVLVVEPMKEPYIKDIGTDLKSMQSAVDGDIQAIYPYDDLVAIVCNEEGKINGLPLNRAVYDEDKTMIDIIAGTFLVTGLTEDNFGSLDVDLIKKYSDMFKYPEQFFMVDSEIKAIPIKPSIRQQLDKAKKEQKTAPQNVNTKNNDLEHSC